MVESGVDACASDTGASARDCVGRFSKVLKCSYHLAGTLNPKQLIIKDCTRRFVLELYRHEASCGLFATAELLVMIILPQSQAAQLRQHCVNGDRPSQWEMANSDPSQNRNP